MLGFSVSNEELKVFIAELEDQLQRLESLILKLEKSTGPDTIQELFRITHTIKGSAAIIGHQSMTGLAHGMESLFDGIRKGSIKISPELVNQLLQALDGLEAYKQEIEKGTVSNFNLKELLNNFETFTKPLPDRQSDSYELTVKFHPDSVLPAVRAYQALLKIKMIGELFYSDPLEEELRKEGCSPSSLVVHFKSNQDINALKHSLEAIEGLSEINIQRLASIQPVVHPSEKSNVNLKHDFKSGQTVRVDVEVLDKLMNLVGELVTGKTRLLKIGSYLKDWDEAGTLGCEVVNSIQQLSKIIAQMQEEVMKARLVSIDLIFGKFPRVVRDLAQQSGKEIEFSMEGEETRLDRSLLDEVRDSTVHLLRNAVDHGIESQADRLKNGKDRAGKIRLRSYHQENHVIIELEDDGCGIDLDLIRQRALNSGTMSTEKINSTLPQEILNLIFAPGFSTATHVSDISGRGVGLDVVKQSIQKVGGTIEVQTQKGKGTLFRLRVPFSLAIIQGLQVTLNGTNFVIPLNNVLEIVEISQEQIKELSGQRGLILRGTVIPLVWLGEAYGKTFPEKTMHSVIILSAEGRRVGLLVDSYVGNQEFVIKTMGGYIGGLPGILGATVLPDGAIGLILDVVRFMDLMQQETTVSCN